MQDLFQQYMGTIFANVFFLADLCPSNRTCFVVDMCPPRMKPVIQPPWLRRRPRSLWISTFRASIRTSRVAGARDVGQDVGSGKNLAAERKLESMSSFLFFLAKRNPKGCVFYEALSTVTVT